MTRILFAIGLMISCISSSMCQEEGSLFDILQEKDSLIFSQGFNHCDTTLMRDLLSEDLESFHDQSGILPSKEVMIQMIGSLCDMPYKATRSLKENSLEVFPLYAGGELYGAIQTGVHEFYGEEADKPKYLTSTARFTHVWLIEDGAWKLNTILSYDHVMPD